ncbi:MAG: hypothetical protein KA100_01475 [Rickettsiales bacterium]|nr:hypothetical protein [Rickettsiales bacterium]
MKKFALILLFFVGSCQSLKKNDCPSPTEYDHNLAQNYYDGFGVSRAHLTNEKAGRLFGCNFHKGSDHVYSYNSAWGKKFILVRGGKVITWSENR